jgi:chemotaxis regulatin CheY-phosphate phosphatase CheZ
MALQVQDITSQQIASVLHMIETVRNQLLNTVAHPDGSSVSDNQSAGSEATRAFDVNAQYRPAAERQSIADSIVQRWNATKQHEERL